MIAIVLFLGNKKKNILAALTRWKEDDQRWSLWNIYDWWGKYDQFMRQIWQRFMEQYDQRLWNKYDWWRHLEEMKNAFGRKVLVGDERLLGGREHHSWWIRSSSSSCMIEDCDILCVRRLGYIVSSQDHRIIRPSLIFP